MSDVGTQAPAKKRRSVKSTFLIVFVLVLLGFFGGWYLLGGGGKVLAELFSDSAEPESTIVSVEPDPPGVEESRVVEERLEKLETLVISLDNARREQRELLGSLQDFVRSEDLQASSSRLRAEIRAVRASFPEAAALEGSQVTLAWHLLQLAEMEHRLFGNAATVSSLLQRVGHLLRDHPPAMDILVDLARLEEELSEPQALGLLEASDEFTAMGELAARIPLLQSEYDPIPRTATGILDRVGAGLRSLVRIERLEPRDAQYEVSRLQLMLGLERMQVALLRRDGAAFERQRASMLAWLEGHAQMGHQDSQDLRARLENLKEIDLGVQAADFASLLARLGELVE